MFINIHEHSILTATVIVTGIIQFHNKRYSNFSHFKITSCILDQELSQLNLFFLFLLGRPPTKKSNVLTFQIGLV